MNAATSQRDHLHSISASLTFFGARFSAHTSFQGPRSPVHAKPRESIESRAFVFFA
ncbi:uncharacterized protein METZ01_LOCUS97248 [marine metagenome]|uniref:Uncharacterized protein n=1 Tax=marine metagenome TaxID=408172 RepID=A0A381VVT4_9ZZZZ